jgi:ribonuclease HII
VVLARRAAPARAIVRRSRRQWTCRPPWTGTASARCAGVDEAVAGPAPGRWSSRLRAAPGDAKRLDGLTDSKLLTAAAREEYYALITRLGGDHAVVSSRPTEVDRRGVHVANIEGMRRAVAAARRPARVRAHRRLPGARLRRPALAVPKGDQVGGLRRGGRRCWPR